MKPLVTTELKRFNYLTSELDAAYHEAALKLQLSDSAMMILYAIRSNGEHCLLHDICKLSGISKQTINSALRKLEADDILYLKTTDGKKKSAFLTEKGRQLAEQTVVRIIEIENDIFNSWTNEEKDLYLELTQRFLTTFQNRIKEFDKGEKTT